MEIDNRVRPIPEDPHPDMEGRIEFLRSTYPYPGCERLAYGIKATRGHIRGDDAEVLYRALKPYFDNRSVGKTVGVEEGRNGGADVVEHPVR